MAKKSATLNLDTRIERILTKRCARLGKPLDEVLQESSIRDIVLQESYAAVSRLVSAGEVPEAVVAAIEAGE